MVGKGIFFVRRRRLVLIDDSYHSNVEDTAIPPLEPQCFESCMAAISRGSDLFFIINSSMSMVD
jgi:hypothetical protein